eukprot:scaffold2360_cov380-Prasinococcus_capsulatus_cf.AAC.6
MMSYVKQCAVMSSHFGNNLSCVGYNLHTTSHSAPQYGLHNLLANPATKVVRRSTTSRMSNRKGQCLPQASIQRPSELGTLDTVDDPHWTEFVSRS